MNNHSNHLNGKSGSPGAAAEEFQLFFFSELIKRPVCAEKITNRLGRVTDLMFRIKDPHPEAVGIYIDHGWEKPNEFVPWDQVVKIEDDAIFVTRPNNGGAYPPLQEQTGCILVNEHLMGCTIFDMDGRRTEVVNDVQFIYSKRRMVLVHVDISFNGFLRRWGLGRLTWIKDEFISWHYVQPLSVQDTQTDAVSLSVTRNQIRDLPKEDLAEVLEELTGKEQEAVFSALDSEKAAKVLTEVEPRAQRQLVANLREEKARIILSEMSIPQLATLFSVLPHDHMTDMMKLLPKEEAERIKAIMAAHESTARALMSTDFVAFPKGTTVGEVLKDLRTSKRAHDIISYVYVVGEDRRLLGVVDLRDLVLTADGLFIEDLMISPPVAMQEDDMREDVAEVLAKYHFHIIPVVDTKDHILGVIHYKDIMKGLVTHAVI